MKQVVHLFLHTHWDREWYRTFEAYRHRLFQVMDEMFSFLDAHSECVFLLDGQTIVLDDYLAIHPEDEPRLKSLIQAGRLQIGPWYVLPDEFLVSGEALIRNLQMGIADAQKWGQENFYGYLPDMFGHIAQMPAILKQSGLEPAILWRGVNPRFNMFDWRSLDNQVIQAIHLTKGYYQDAFHDPEHLNEKLDPFLKGVIEAVPKNGAALLPVGGDHLGLPKDIHAQIASLNQDFPETEFRLSSLTEYIQDIEELGFHRETVSGELRNCESSYILPGVLSSRVYLKQKNVALQQLLERQVEPFLAWNWLKGKGHPTAQLRQAWKYLLQNHPHDSICGCSIDEVHQDMMPRFRWAKTIGQELLDSGATQTLGHSRTEQVGDYLNIIHFGAGLWQGALRVTIEFPFDEGVEAFGLYDPESDEPVDFEIIKYRDEEKFVSEPDILPHWEKVRRFVCLLPLKLTSMSVKAFKITKETVPEKAKPAISSDSTAIENAFAKVVINTETGRIGIYRKEEFMWIKSLQGPVFLDEGDAGDSYNYSPPIQDQKIVIPFQDSKVEKKRLVQRLYLTYHGALPAQLNQDRLKRSKVNVPCQIRTMIELRADDPTIYFKTKVNNQAKDHRLKLMFQALHPPVRCWASTAFGSIEREAPPPRAIDVPTGKERPADTFPIQDWVQLSTADDKGFTFVGQGLHEGWFQDWEGKPTLAVTLIRSVGWLSRDDLRTRGGGAGPRMKTPEAQCLGEHEFNYTLAMTGNDRKHVLDHVHQQRFQPVVYQGFDKADDELFYIRPKSMTVTAFKKADHDDALILRCVNLNDHPVKFRLHPKFDTEKIKLSDPLERCGELLCEPGEEQKIQRICQPAEILTFKIYPQSSDNRS